MGNNISKSDSFLMSVFRSKNSNDSSNRVTAAVNDDSTDAFEHPEEIYYEYYPFLDTVFWLSRAQTMLCHGHQCEVESKFELALNSFVHAVDVLYFISKHCLKKGNANIDKVRMQTAVAIRRVIILRAIVESRKKVNVECLAQKYKGPQPTEAMKQLLETLPESDKELIQCLNHMVIMEVLDVKFEAIVGLDEAKLAMTEEIVHHRHTTQEIAYKLGYPTYVNIVVILVS